MGLGNRSADLCIPSGSAINLTAAPPPPVPPLPPLQTVVVYAATKGYMDKVPVNKIVAAEEAVLKSVDPRIFKVLKSKGKITPEIDAHIKQQLSKVVFPK